MPPNRDSQGRIVTPPEYASAEFRAHALALQRAGSSIRAIAAETGRSKTALVRDLAQAREEEAAAKATARAEKTAAASQPESRPAARVDVGVEGVGLQTPRGQAVGGLLPLKPVREYTPAQEVIRIERENDRLQLAAWRRAGLSDSGDASYETHLGRGGYDPADPSDVERVRSIIRDDWYRHRLAEGDSEEVAQASADEQADAWQPHPGLR